MNTKKSLLNRIFEQNVSVNYNDFITFESKIVLSRLNSITSGLFDLG